MTKAVTLHMPIAYEVISGLCSEAVSDLDFAGCRIFSCSLLLFLEKSHCRRRFIIFYNFRFGGNCASVIGTMVSANLLILLSSLSSFFCHFLPPLIESHSARFLSVMLRGDKMKLQSASFPKIGNLGTFLVCSESCRRIVMLAFQKVTLNSPTYFLIFLNQNY